MLHDNLRIVHMDWKSTFAIAMAVFVVCHTPTAKGQTSANWAAAESGPWHQPSRWLPEGVPNGGDVAATIDVTGGRYTISLDQDATVDELLINSPDAELRHTEGSLTVDRLEIKAGTYEFLSPTNPTILDANEIIVSGGDFVINADPNSSRIRGASIVSDTPLSLGYVRLEDVTLGSDVTTMDGAVIPFDGDLHIANDAMITLANGQLFGQTDGASLTGMGTFVLQSGSLGVDRGTMGPGITVQVSENSRDNQLDFDRLEGNVNVASGGVLRIGSYQFSNEGRIETDGYVSINTGERPFEKLGAIRVGPTGVLETYSTIRLSDLALIEDDTVTGHLFFGGTLNLDRETLDLDALPFRQKALFERIAGGRISGSAAAYDISPRDQLFLHDVTLAANLTSDNRIMIDGILEMDGATIELSVHGSLEFFSAAPGDPMVSGRGTVRMLGHSRVFGGDAIIGPDIQLQLMGSSHRLDVYRNDGKIQADVPSDVYVGINRGNIVLNGQSDEATFRYGKESDNTWANEGTVRLERGTLELIGSYSAASLGNLEHVGGHLRFGGVYDNQGQVLELSRNRSLQAELLGGTVRAVAGDTAMIAGVFRGETTLQGRFETSGISARHLNLDNATLVVSGNVFTDQLTGKGHIALSGGRFQVVGATGFEVTSELSLGVERGAQSDLFMPVTNRGTLEIEPDARLGVQSLVNRGLIDLREGGTLEVYESVNQPDDAGGTWLLDPRASLVGASDFKLGARDLTTAFLSTGSDQPATLRSSGTFTQAGTLEVRLPADHRARTGQSYKLIDAAEIAGEFQDVLLPLVPQPFSWDQSQLATTGSLSVVGPEAEHVAGTRFSSATIGSDSYVTLPDSLELGFVSRSVRTGVNPQLRIEMDPDTFLNRLTHRSVRGVTEFDVADVSEFREVVVSFELSVDETGYESGDFVEFSASFAGDQVSVLLDDADLRAVSGSGVQTYSMILPNYWQSAQVVMTTQSNSSRGSEAYFLHSLAVTGFRHELFIEQGDFNRNGILDHEDIDLLTLAIINQSDDERFNYGNDALNDQDRDFWVKSVASTSYGDANLDGVFDSGDLVAVFVAGEFEDGIAGNSGWASGDWNGDQEFDTGDLVWVFQEGNYRVATATRAIAVPEPTGTLLPLLFVSLLLWQRLSASISQPDLAESRTTRLNGRPNGILQ